MGLIRKGIAAALIYKAVEQLRKPENQQKIREAVDKQRARSAPHRP